jgi:hypothetical protein
MYFIISSNEGQVELDQVLETDIEDFFDEKWPEEVVRLCDGDLEDVSDVRYRDIILIKGKLITDLEEVYA